jgi:hypothetical protein
VEPGKNELVFRRLREKIGNEMKFKKQNKTKQKKKTRKARWQRRKESSQRRGSWWSTGQDAKFCNKEVIN